MKCVGCNSEGFEASAIGPDRCTFCDGTEGGHPPQHISIIARGTPVEDPNYMLVQCGKRGE